MRCKYAEASRGNIRSAPLPFVMAIYASMKAWVMGGCAVRSRLEQTDTVIHHAPRSSIRGRQMAHLGDEGVAVAGATQDQKKRQRIIIKKESAPERNRRCKRGIQRLFETQGRRWRHLSRFLRELIAHKVQGREGPKQRSDRRDRLMLILPQRQPTRVYE